MIDSIEVVPLSGTDLRISRIVFGCWTIGGYGWGTVNDQDSVRAIRRALELGINCFDTADVYGVGHSERILAKALGSRRHDVVIATKFGVRVEATGRTFRDTRPAYVVAALEQSLRNLNVDCIPLYQLHWPDGRTPIVDTMAALVRCRDAGKIRWIGCCNLPLEAAEEACSAGPIVSLQSPFNLVNTEAESIIGLCRDRRISLLAYSPLGLGLLSGKHGEGAVRFAEGDVRTRSGYFDEANHARNSRVVARLRDVAVRLDKTPAQVAIRWVLDHPGVTATVTGIRTAQQVEENSGALGWRLSDATRRFLTP